MRTVTGWTGRKAVVFMFIRVFGKKPDAQVLACAHRFRQQNAMSGQGTRGPPQIPPRHSEAAPCKALGLAREVGARDQLSKRRWWGGEDAVWTFLCTGLQPEFACDCVCLTSDV